MQKFTYAANDLYHHEIHSPSIFLVLIQWTSYHRKVNPDLVSITLTCHQPNVRQAWSKLSYTKLQTVPFYFFPLGIIGSNFIEISTERHRHLCPERNSYKKILMDRWTTTSLYCTFAMMINRVKQSLHRLNSRKRPVTVVGASKHCYTYLPCNISNKRKYSYSTLFLFTARSEKRAYVLNWSRWIKGRLILLSNNL